jgi:hypothetical protein
MQCGVVNTKENGSDEPSSQSASSFTQRSRVGRTLLFAGVFALLAMLFVPMPMQRGSGGGGYRWIFSQSNTGIAFFQLLANVAFAALAGVIAAHLPKRVLYVIGACLTIAVVVFEAEQFTDRAGKRAWSAEEYAKQMLSVSAEEAARYFHNSATNWRFALNFHKAAEVEERALDTERRAAEINAGINAGIAARAREDAERRAREAERAALAFIPDQIVPSQWDEYLLAKRKQEDEDCHKEIRLHKWDHLTDAGKTFMIGVFFERHVGDRKAEVDAAAKLIGARFYNLWERHKRGDIEEVKVVFYK